MDTISRKNELIEKLNETLKLCEPIDYNDFNIFIPVCLDKKIELETYEKLNPKIGLANPLKFGDVSLFEEKTKGFVRVDKTLGISILSIIATITDYLADFRLAAIINMDTGIIIGFKEYNK